MRAALAITLLASGCVTADESVEMPRHETAAITSFAVEATTDTADPCSLAAALPGDDACSLVCDPDAFAARLVDDGMAAGRCYELRCTLSPDVSVSVGVCLL